jgi:Reverse transcriptase (RNA-dependent DNA polymerase)/Endonuclease-reverse transcriptase
MSKPDNNEMNANFQMKEYQDLNLRIMQQNFRSISGKVSKFQSDILIYDPDVILGNETWLDESITDSQIFPPGYNIYRKDRNRNGGGVFIAVKTKYKTQLEKFNLNSEQIWVMLELPSGKKLRIGTGYRSPTSGNVLINDVATVLSGYGATRTQRKFILFGGDLNLPSINWPRNQVDHPIAYGRELNNLAIQTFQDSDLKQVVKTPTRIENGHEAILDVVLTNQAHLVENVMVTDGISDHKTVIVDLKFASRTADKPKIRKTVYLYSRADIDHIKEQLQQNLPQFKDDATNLTSNELWKKFTDLCNALQEQHIPQKVFIVNGKDPPWYNNYLRKLAKKCQRAHKKRNIKNTNAERYRALRRELKWNLFQAESRFLTSLSTADVPSSKRLWSFIKYKHSHLSLSGVSSITNDDGEMISDSKQKADALNNYFGSVFVKDRPVPNQEPIVFPQNLEPHQMPNINAEGIITVIKNLKSDAAPGPDEIGPKFLKLVPDTISQYLLEIFNLSLSTHELPHQWKTANVVPIFKTGEKTKVQNYRPISLTCTSCKILEHILVSSTATYLEQNSLFNKNQHGFRKKLSCETQVKSVYHKLVTTRDKGHSTDLIFLDFMKAFDKVPHNLLLKKLTDLGINEDMICWIKNYLTNRTQSVTLEGVKSSVINVTSGVPQGSVLGPLLFLVYINNIDEGVESNLGLYADDCALYREIVNPDDEEILQTDLNKIVRWSERWFLPLNISKCKSMRTCVAHVHSGNHVYSINATNLEKVTNYKYLGVTLAEELTWNRHIDKVVNKASRVLGFIKSTLFRAAKKVKETTYKTLVRPILEFCASLWDPHQQYLCDNIEMVQRRAARFVTNTYHPLASVTEILNQLQWPTLHERRQIDKFVSLFKLVFNEVNYDLSQHIQIHPHILPRNHPYKLSNIMGVRNTNQHHFSFLPQAIRDWNVLPKSIFDPIPPSAAVFKHRLELYYGFRYQGVP